MEELNYTVVADDALEGDEWVQAIVVSPDERHLVCALAKDGFRVWDLSKRKSRTRLHEIGKLTLAVCLTPDGSTIVSGSDDNLLRTWDLWTLEPAKTFKGHEDGIRCVTALSDNRRVLSASTDGTVRMWDTSSAECLQVFREHEGEVWCVAASRDDRIAVSGDSTGHLALWNLENRKHLGTMGRHAGMVLSVQITPDGQKAVSSGQDKIINVWDLRSQKCVDTLEGHRKEVKCVAVSPDGRLAASACIEDGTVRLWNLRKGKCVRVVPNPEGRGFASVAFAPNGRRLFAGGDTGPHHILIYNLAHSRLEEMEKIMNPSELRRRVLDLLRISPTGSISLSDDRLAQLLSSDSYEPVQHALRSLRDDGSIEWYREGHGGKNNITLIRDPGDPPATAFDIECVKCGAVNAVRLGTSEPCKKCGNRISLDFFALEEIRGGTATYRSAFAKAKTSEDHHMAPDEKTRESIFIVHGRDMNARRALDLFLTKELGLHTIVLEDEPFHGKTTIEKFEHYSEACNRAVVLITPDDVALEGGEPKRRARQNVIYELGYFHGKLGRENVCIVVRSDVELDWPSDLHGLGEIRFRKDIKEIHEQIRKELAVAPKKP